MRLYLVRHGDAKSKQQDANRRLTPRGEKESRAVGEFLASSGAVHPARILHSGKLRAQQTAEIIAQCLGVSSVTKTDHLDPEAHPELWAEQLDGEKDDLMLVGHLPYMSRMVALLLLGDADGELVAFPMAAVCCLFRDEEGLWLLEWLVSPALLG
jgi:phosphohistidine phosphatase